MTSTLEPGAIKAGRRGHILVVEDNLINQKVASALLERLGFSSDVVGNGVLAVEAASRGGYSLILMDWHMPEMDGVEATKEIRRREPEGSRLPVIAFTAAGVTPPAEELAVVGLDDWIRKPAGLAELRAMLQKWLPDAFAEPPNT